MAGAAPPPPQPRALPAVAAWTAGVVAALAMAATSVVSVGLAVIFWGPMLVVLGIGMWGVWVARRHRQAMQGRDSYDRKDPLHGDRPWPTEGVVDDRLPEP